MTPRVSILTPVQANDAQAVAWLEDCLTSVAVQTAGDWEHIVVDDHSRADLSEAKARWPDVRWLDAEYRGVSAARNQAAEAARGELLLPLDGDDKLPPMALEVFLRTWRDRGKAGILYSDVMLFGEDYARVLLAPEYSFPLLLSAAYMTVGCLHRRADWEAVGGWRLDMGHGLEDWEYWIALGEMSVCGKRVPEPLYYYRRHPRGRLSWLEATRARWHEAYAAMRDLHRDTYNGRQPMGCCGGNRRVVQRRGRGQHVPPPAPKEQPGMKQIVYTGKRSVSFVAQALPTKTMYDVPGPGQLVELAGTGKPGVLPQDVAWFRSVNRGHDFRILDYPEQYADAAPEAVTETAPPEPPLEEPWEPRTLEDGARPLPDPSALTVKQIRELEVGPGEARALLAQEQAGKGRKTVLAHLEGLVDA